MKFKYLDNVRPLYSFSDYQLIKIVMLYSMGTYQVNSRDIILVETRYSENHDFSTLQFRITTQSYEQKSDVFVSGFMLQFDIDQRDLYFTPLNKLTCYTESLERLGITEDFASHMLGTKRVYDFFKNELKLWDRLGKIDFPVLVDDDVIEWKKVHGDFAVI